MTIHDFDMARYVAGTEVVTVFATGAVRVDPRIGAAGDIDTAVTLLTHADGTITTIDNSREAVYGYDQRIEAFGSLGLSVSDNPSTHFGWTMTRAGTSGQPLPWFFLERYRDSYRLQWEAFRAYLAAPGPSPAGPDAARACTAIALAAGASLREGRAITIAPA